MATTARKGSAKAAAKQGDPTTVVTSAKISEEDIRFRAYEISQTRARSGLSGDAMSDWLQAERELVSQALTARPKRTTRV